MQIISMAAILESYENHINSPWGYFETFVKYIMTMLIFISIRYLIEINYSSYAIIHTYFGLIEEVFLTSNSSKSSANIFR